MDEHSPYFPLKNRENQFMLAAFKLGANNAA
jgi:hypothetical protein